jgi:competence protein ComEC
MIKKVSLFQQRRDFLFAFFLLLFLSLYSLLIEYNNYKNLTRFDSQLVTATLLKQYDKTKLTKKGKLKSYKVIKLESDNGFTFYSSIKSKKLQIGQTLNLEIWAGKVSFYEYLSGFYAFSKILSISLNIQPKERLNKLIQEQHTNKTIAHIYQALFIARQLSSNIQQKFSSLGISHLIAISGFHLGVLSALLFFLFKKPYQFFQNRYFPYRSYKVDSFIIISTVLLGYLLFLDSPDSLLRAFGMLIIGFFLYDRGMKLVTMETFFIAIFLLLALFPRLLFSIGFGLSAAGVGSIFLFLIHFKSLSKLWQFILIPFWVYLLMLPYSIVIFGNFSLYHPLSILWSTLFTLFYPLSIFLHLIGQGDLVDFVLEFLLNLDTHTTHTTHISLSFGWLIPYIILSLGAIYSKKLALFTLLYSITIFIYAIYNVT